jgi:phosphopantetheinyl transferase
MADAPIGVDIEPLREVEPPWSLLHPNERETLETLTGAARMDAFLRLWTAKEAYLKALGVGFARDPTRIAIGFDFSILDEAGAPEIGARGWRRFALNGDPFIAACVALG